MVHIRVAMQELHGHTDVIAIFAQMRGEGMAEGMTGSVFVHTRCVNGGLHRFFGTRARPRGGAGYDPCADQASDRV